MGEKAEGILVFPSIVKGGFVVGGQYGEGAGERISYRGVGASDLLHNNLLPEGRAFNRTVTITLEYMTKE